MSRQPKDGSGDDEQREKALEHTHAKNDEKTPKASDRDLD
jgi:hypothetical protein